MEHGAFYFIMIFIDNFNEYLKVERAKNNIKCNSFIVLHTKIKESSFKAIKTYIISAYIVKQNKDNILLFTESHNYNTSKVAPEDINRDLEKYVTMALLGIIGDNILFNNILIGKYGV